MIEKIEIKGVASYDINGVSFEELQKINFIYGSNGSGKTTISNFFQNQAGNKYQSSSIKWKDDRKIDILVYNKIFKENNFNSSNNIKGVFTLGKATDTEKKIIDKKKDKLEDIEVKGNGYRKSLQELKGNEESLGKLQKLENDFKEFCWKDIYKKNENMFKEAFKGFLKKDSFREKILNEYRNNKSKQLDIAELQKKSKIIFGETPTKLSLIPMIIYSDIQKIENNAIWAKKIIGKTDVNIATIIQKLGINDWVDEGRKYIGDSDICPFCQNKTVTHDFRKQLEEYFDETYADSIKKINSLKQNYDNLSKNIIDKLSNIEQDCKVDKKTKLDIDNVSIALKSLIGQLEINRQNLQNKLKEPSRDIKIASSEKHFEMINDIINEANKEISKHNEIVENYSKERKQLNDEIWKFLVATHNDEIKLYLKNKKGLDDGIQKLTNSYSEKRNEWIKLNNEIKNLEKNITSIKPTIDEINRMLKYYNFIDFEIVPSKDEKNCYQIKRSDGSLAQETLSEGEITFITFLYYYQLTKGSTDEKNISNNRVLVIDDPVSSLDSNILFIVSTLIKGIIEDIRSNNGNIKQLIILTHNIYFHKEISFINSRDTGERNDTNFWIIRKNNKVSKLFFYKNNPIKTSYELLWQEIRELNNNSISTIQNTMRRIIENYFKILGDYKDDSLIEQFNTHEEQIICKSLISWLHDGSHSVYEGLFIEDQNDSIGKYLEVFKKIFRFTGHEGHYNMMMKIDNTINNQ